MGANISHYTVVPFVSLNKAPLLLLCWLAAIPLTATHSGELVTR